MRPKILVARLSAIGDVVRTVPAVKALRKIFPDSEIHWLVEDQCATIIEGLFFVNQLKIVPRQEWKTLPFIKKVQAFLAFIRKLRIEQYNIYIDFHGILKSGLYGFFAGIPRRIGYPYGIAKEFNTLFTNEKISAVSEKMSRYTRNFLLPLHFDTSLTQEPAYLPLSPDDRLFANRFLEDHGLKGKGFVLIYPGTSIKGQYKRWMPERYGQLVDGIFEKLSLPTVIGWGPGEDEIVTVLQENCAYSPIVLPPTTLKELCAVIEKALIFVGGDTGFMYMASIVGTPLVTIFGPSDPVTNQPSHFTPFRIVYAGVGCSPCHKRKCTKLYCLHAVTAEMVLKTISELLAEIGHHSSN